MRVVNFPVETQTDFDEMEFEKNFEVPSDYRMSTMGAAREAYDYTQDRKGIQAFSFGQGNPEDDFSYEMQQETLIAQAPKRRSSIVKQEKVAKTNPGGGGCGGNCKV